MDTFASLRKWLPKKKIRNAIFIFFFCIATLLGNVISSGILQFDLLFSGKWESGGVPWWTYISFHMVSFWFLYLFLYIAFFIGSCVFWLQLKSSYESLEEGKKGTARFTYLEELLEQYKAVPMKAKNDETYPGLSGTLISRYKDKALIDDGPAHNLIIGRSRSGKDQTKVLPDIDLYSRSEEKPSMVIASTKYENLAGAKKVLERRGYDVSALNLIHLDYSMMYNCLELVKDAYKEGDVDEAIELCKTFSYPLYHNKNAKEPVWEDTAMALVNAIILALCYEFIEKSDDVSKTEKYVSMFAVANMLVELANPDEKGETLLEKYFASLPAGNPAKIQYSTVRLAEGQMQASIFASTQAKLQKFVAPKVAKMMAKSSFQFEDLSYGERPQAVFLVLPDYVETNYIIASTWVQQAYYVLSKKASEEPGDKLPRRVRMVLNEFGNLPAFTNMGSMLSVGAGRGILFDFYIQDYSQLKILYEDYVAKLISSQSMNRFFILSGDSDTRDDFSKILGPKEVTVKSRSGPVFSIHKQITESVDTRALLLPDELGRLREGENVIERSVKRQDLQGNPITPYPIFNQGATRFSYAYEYLMDQFDANVKYTELGLPKVVSLPLDKYSQEFIRRIKQPLIDDMERQNALLEKEGGVEALANDPNAGIDQIYTDYAAEKVPVDLSEQEVVKLAEEKTPLDKAYTAMEQVVIYTMALEMYPEEEETLNEFEYVEDYLAFIRMPEHHVLKQKYEENNYFVK